MKAKIRVHGKSQSRTALGIVIAYLKLNPDSSLSDLQNAFPKSLNSKSPLDEIIVSLKDTEGHEKLFFEKEDELITLGTGQKLALVETWVKEDFEAICEHAKQYGIDVAGIEEARPFEKGSFELEYLNKVDSVAAAPVADPIPVKKKCSWWWWLLLLLLLLLILFFCFRKCCTEGKSGCAVPVDTTSVKPTAMDAFKGKLDTLTNNFVYATGDTVIVKLPDGKEWKVGENSTEYKLFSFLNSDAKVDTLDKTIGWITLDRLYFDTGKANLTPESENQLKNIALILNYFPNSKIKMGGYTDNTGTEEINMRLSGERAKVTAEKLVALGVDGSRVSHEGYGQNHPLCPPNDSDACRAVNRRIDVRVTQK